MIEILILGTLNAEIFYLVSPSLTDAPDNRYISPGSICSRFSNFVLNKLCFKYIFKMLKKSNTKFSGYISKFYTFTKWFVCKKTNFSVKKVLYETGCLSFSHKSQKMSFFCKTWCAHVKCRYVSEKILLTYQNVFSVAGVYAPMCRIEFLHISNLSFRVAPYNRYISWSLPSMKSRVSSGVPHNQN